jgi:hypothetical protein
VAVWRFGGVAVWLFGCFAVEIINREELYERSNENDESRI